MVRKSEGFRRQYRAQRLHVSAGKVAPSAAGYASDNPHIHMRGMTDAGIETSRFSGKNRHAAQCAVTGIERCANVVADITGKAQRRAFADQLKVRC